MAVAFREHVWQKSFSIVKNSAFLCIRYVDNRLTLIKTSLTLHSAYKIFTDLNFYCHPIELENCGNNDFLGNTIYLDKGVCEFIVPEHKYFYRSPRSAGSDARVLSGLQARLHLLFRGTFPRSRAKPLLEKLLDKYEQQGFCRQLLHKLAFKISARYKCELSR